jgi:hypothetical protein
MFYCMYELNSMASDGRVHEKLLQVRHESLWMDVDKLGKYIDKVHCHMLR